MGKFCKNAFVILVFLSLFTPLMFWQDLLFPFVTSKAFYFRIVTELAIPFYFYLLFLNKNLRPSFKNPISIFVLVFLFVSIISGIFGFNPARSMWGDFERMGGNFYLAHLSLLYFYLVTLAKLDGVVFKRFLQGVVILGFVSVVLGFLGHAGVIALFKKASEERASSVFGNPIFFASFLILPMFVSMWLGKIAETKAGKFWYYGVFILSLFAIYLSATRGALVGLVVGSLAGFACYAFFSLNKKLKVYASIFFIALIVFGGFFVVKIFKQSKVATQRSLFNLNDSNTQSRFLLWKMAVKGFQEKPLLGSGPENFYIFSNKYYDPKIYSLDNSWFDKPHNYFLEILSTTGILGFVSFLALLGACFWALFLAFKKDILTLLEFALLVCGFTAYQVQNLFVFDTVSSSIMFFVFLSLATFLASFENGINPEKKNTNKKISEFLLPLFWVVSVFVAYVIYATNYIAIEINWRIHFGQVLTGKEYKLAEKYFTEIEDLPFNFYLNEWAHYQSLFALNLFPIKNPEGQPSKKEVEEILNRAILVNEKTLKEDPTNPIGWLDLANLYRSKVLNFDPSLAQKPHEFAAKAKSLAPKRFDVQGFSALLYISADKLAEAEKVYTEMRKDYPNEPELLWHLASVYFFEGKKDMAFEMATGVLKTGYAPQPLGKIDWLMDEYAQKNRLKEFAEILEFVGMQNSNNKEIYLKLSAIYSQLGDQTAYVKALEKAKAIEEKEKAKDQYILQKTTR